MTQPADQSGPIPVPPDPDERITFLRSTTTTTINRERDGDSSTRVEHLARFAVRDDAMGALAARSYNFQPNWMEARWINGQLDSVLVSGPRILISGGLSAQTTGRKHWGQWSTKAVDRTELPAAVAERIGAYEVAVSTMTGQR